MPVLVDRDLPAYSILMAEGRDIVPKDTTNARLRIALVNLMPTKIETETQFARLLSFSPEAVGLDLIHMESHNHQSTDMEHIRQFCMPSSWLYGNQPDAVIITGAPVELLDFGQVDYWKELCSLLDWIFWNVKTSMFVCWGAQAALYRFFGIGKRPLEDKLFGVFKHEICLLGHPLTNNLDRDFLAPHSRYTENPLDEIACNPNLEILCSSKKAGTFLSWAPQRQMFFMSGHPEYDADTLKNEYERDMRKGLGTAMPEFYFENNNPQDNIRNTWEQTGRIIYSNWLAHYVSR